MEEQYQRNLKTYIAARREHPAWRLLASSTAPSVIASLQVLFDSSNADTDGIELEYAHEILAEALETQNAAEDLAVDISNLALAARRELRQWIRKGLIVERQGRIWATDALQKALAFITQLDTRLMTSTASRLLTVQREIERLEVNLNPNPESRVRHLEQQIVQLQAELASVREGNFKVLEGQEAVEGIREVYNLATSLKSDFRRVEDSYRDADKQLRETIISEERHRGEVVDKLLNTHEHLLATSEGQVFHNFHQQLRQEIQLDDMSHRLKTILSHPGCQRALDRQQQNELRWLKSHLVSESATVIRARARGERDVKGFLKTGLAVEHHRVGQLLKDIFQAAVDIDWSSSKVRRSPSPIKPVAVACGQSPLVERLRFTQMDNDAQVELDLSRQLGNLDDIGEDFWEALDSLDREQLFEDTRQYLSQTNEPTSVADLALAFKPEHDLESIALWLNLAQRVDVITAGETEEFDLIDFALDKSGVRYRVPKAAFTLGALANTDWEEVEG